MADVMPETIESLIIAIFKQILKISGTFSTNDCKFVPGVKITAQGRSNYHTTIKIEDECIKIGNFKEHLSNSQNFHLSKISQFDFQIEN